ncbi:MAG: PP2C family protein-serine/threonine phosphatase, partial [Phycisphaerae bacterium]
LHRRLAAAQQAEASARLAVIRRQQAAINAITTDRTQAIAAAARILPGQERCGDLYTVQALDEHRLLAAAADAGAMGTAGIIQATAMLNALSTAAALAGPRTELGQILTAMNRSTAGRADRQPIPLVAVWIDLVAGRISYVNAGHAAPLLLAGPARLVTLEQTALLPGADPETIYKSASADLPARFRLILVSDGLIEAPDKAGQAFGQERLHEALLSEAAFGQPGQIIELLASALAGHLQDTPQLDDAMIIALAKDSKSS